MTTTTALRCACGSFSLEVAGHPIITTECHCNSCREAGARLEALPSATPILAENGGTPFVLYRKDRLHIVDGESHLAALRLTADSPTRRVVATCCNTPVFLEFQGGHWLSLYSGLWPSETAPAPKIRTMTADVPPGQQLSDALPSGRMVTAGFYAKLLASWIAMGFKSPQLDVPRTLEA